MRRKNDAYYTPEKLVQSLLNNPFFQNLNISGSILEPCCGDGAIASPLREYLEQMGCEYTLETNDIEKDKGDYCKPVIELLKEEKEWDWIISNPPFNQAHEILPKCFEKSRKGMIMLLRISYLEPCKNRRDWLRENKPCLLLFTKRVSFTGKGSDSATTAWIGWSKDKYATKHIDFLF